MELVEGETLEMGPDTPKVVCPELGGPTRKEKTPEIAARGEETQCSGQEQAAGEGSLQLPSCGVRGGEEADGSTAAR